MKFSVFIASIALAASAYGFVADVDYNALEARDPTAEEVDSALESFARSIESREADNTVEANDALANFVNTQIAARDAEADAKFNPAGLLKSIPGQAAHLGGSQALNWGINEIEQHIPGHQQQGAQRRDAKFRAPKISTPKPAAPKPAAPAPKPAAPAAPKPAAPAAPKPSSGGHGGWAGDIGMEILKGGANEGGAQIVSAIAGAAQPSQTAAPARRDAEAEAKLHRSPSVHHKPAPKPAAPAPKPAAPAPKPAAPAPKPAAPAAPKPAAPAAPAAPKPSSGGGAAGFFKDMGKELLGGAANEGGAQAVSAIASAAQPQQTAAARRDAEADAEAKFRMPKIHSSPKPNHGSGGPAGFFKDMGKELLGGAANEGGSLAVSAIASAAQPQQTAAARRDAEADAEAKFRMPKIHHSNPKPAGSSGGPAGFFKDMGKELLGGAANEGGQQAVSAIAGAAQPQQTAAARRDAEAEAKFRMPKIHHSNPKPAGGSGGPAGFFKDMGKELLGGAANEGGSQAVSAIASAAQPQQTAAARRDAEAEAKFRMPKIHHSNPKPAGGSGGPAGFFKDMGKELLGGAANEGGSQAVSAIASAAQPQQTAAARRDAEAEPKLHRSPSVHHKPTKPDTPSKPNTPAQPAKPNTPAQPAKPNTPAQPAKPNTPAQPAKPNQPSPAQPAKPAESNGGGFFHDFLSGGANSAGGHVVDGIASAIQGATNPTSTSTVVPAATGAPAQRRQVRGTGFFGLDEE